MSTNGVHPSNGHEHEHEHAPHLNGNGNGSNGSASILEASGEHAQILKVLDELRRLGIGSGPSVHSLPQIIVCGSQSSGKSSVLEAIAGIPFPRKSGLCTRYKTQVTILRKPKLGVTLTINPDPMRTDPEKRQIEKFRRELDSSGWQESIPAAMAEADRLIFSGSMSTKNWTNDTLAITITDPHKQDLQLLDLPGLIKVDKHNEGAIAMVERMVTDEMKKPHSIVLAVARATDDLEHHEILQMCKNLNVDSRRTLGVLTMPDLAGSKANTYVSMVQGLDKTFKKTFPMDWHVLLNRSEEDLNSESSTFDRDEKEARFFHETTPWNKLTPKDTGIDELRRRLSTLLFTVAKRELPNLFQSMSTQKATLQQSLESLGGDLTDPELRKAFRKSLERLKSKANDHARGIYESDIRNLDGSHPAHLRSRIVEQNEVFRDKLLEMGHAWDLESRRSKSIDPDGDLQSIHREPFNVQQQAVHVKSEEEAIDEFGRLLNSMRGRGLPGFNNEDVVNKAFWLLTEEWKTIGTEHIGRVFKCCEEYFESMTSVYFAKPPRTTLENTVGGFGNNEDVALRFRRKYLKPALDRKKTEALIELEKLEEDRLDICQNLDRNFLSEFRLTRERRLMKRAMDLVHNSQELENEGETEPAQVGKFLHLHTQEDWTAETAKDLLNAVWTHYGIVSRQFVANVSMQVVERHLMRIVDQIIYDDLELPQMRELVKAEDDVERRKERIRDELELLTNSMAALEPFAYS